MKKILYILVAVALASVFTFAAYTFLLPGRPVCGNNVCELFETPETCCKDCECWNAEVCNMDLNKCEKREINITDERIKELVVQYFGNKGEEVVVMNITSVINWKNTLGKNVMVQVSGQDSPIPLIVLEDERIIEFNI